MTKRQLSEEEEKRTAKRLHEIEIDILPRLKFLKRHTELMLYEGIDWNALEKKKALKKDLIAIEEEIKVTTNESVLLEDQLQNGITSKEE